MIKLTYCIRRRSDVSAPAFRKYWRENHAPLVTRHAKALRAVRYVQSHTPLDGITEVWWESLEDLAAALASPEGQAAGAELLEDERRFIDFASSSLFMTEEHEIFDFTRA
jgi:uncharacterized protein (TIGR02118 family)